VVHRRDREVGPPDAAAGQPQPVEGLRRGDLVDQVEVDVQERDAVILPDDVTLPQLVEEALRDR
jgi:hypothetical protein